MKPQGSAAPDVLERNKETVRRIWQAFNTGDTSELDQLIDPGVVYHNPPPGKAHLKGSENVKDQIRMIREQFPDVKFEEEGIVAEGDVVHARWVMTGTNTGPIYGRKPTGVKIRHRGHEIIRLRNGKVVEHDDSADELEFLDKLGILDQPMLEFVRKNKTKRHD